MMSVFIIHIRLLDLLVFLFCFGTHLFIHALKCESKHTHQHFNTRLTLPQTFVFCLSNFCTLPLSLSLSLFFSLSLSLTHTQTIGYGDVGPVNHEERMYTIFVAISGVIIFAFAMGNVTRWKKEKKQNYFTIISLLGEGVSRAAN